MDNKDESKMNPLGRPLTIVFALPGDQFSSKFLLSWTMLFNYCVNHNINPLVTNHNLENIYYTRNACMGGNNISGIDQKPLGGEINYDFVMWIDPNMVFTVENFTKLLAHDVDVIGGIYLKDAGKHFNTCRELDNNYFVRNGHFEYFAGEELLKRRENKDEPVLDVDFTGMGWMLVKRGVFEKMSYPWFKPEYFEIKTIDGSNNENTIREFTSDEVGFCMTAKNLGFTVKVDTDVVVGIEKPVVVA